MPTKKTDRTEALFEAILAELRGIHALVLANTPGHVLEWERQPEAGKEEPSQNQTEPEEG